MSYDYLTFDCYGTLIDWRAGIVRAFRDAAGPSAELPDDDDILQRYAEHEAAVEAGRYRSYREVLAETARRLARDLGLERAFPSFGFLADSLSQWPAFPDTNPALARLHRAGLKLGILSNVDDDLLAGTLRRLEVDFQLLITAEQVGSYKPARAHFRAAQQRIGDRVWLHVAQSLFHDLAPAAKLGLPAVWVNRLGEPLVPGIRPLRTFQDLAGLAEWLVSDHAELPYNSPQARAPG